MKTESIVMDEQIDAPTVILDDEDTEDLLVDCHALLTRALDRQNPLWLQQDGSKLLSRLEEALSWYRIH